MSRALVVTASYDKQVRFWDAASGRTVRHFTFQDSQVNALLLIPEVQCLAVAGFGVIRLYNLAPNASAVNNNGGAAVPQGVNQAPPLISSYESQGSMNFTSMGYFPITRRNGAEGNFESMGTLADSVLGLWRLPVELIGNTVVFPETSAKEYSLVLYATSEDGHIRFFDAQSPTTLRLLKDIAIGVALTCSALSPDRRYLLTGSQIGQVAVWHLPSIVASMESEAKNIGGNVIMGANNTGNNNAAGVRRGSLVSANMQHPQQQSAESEERRRLREHFGSHPLQEISFDTNYPAIRSIAIEPLGRWSAIATNAGKLHFLRFSHDGRLGGSKALRPTFATATNTTTTPAGAASGAVTNNSTATTPQAPTTNHRHHHHHHQQHQQSGQAEAGNATLANAEARPSRSSSEQDLPLLGISPDQSAPGPKESIYRSALVVNEINSELVSQAALQSGSATLGAAVAHTAPNSTPTSSMGAALLSNLSHVQNSMNEGDQTPERQPTTQLRGGSDDARTLATSAGDDGARTPNKAADKNNNNDGEKNNNTSPIVDVATELQEELEMEVFHTFHAHYKYILKVAISPNGELLATCSADYTVGRFLVPQLLRSPPEGLGSTLTHVPTTNLGAGVIGGYHDDTTSLASTQTPHAQLTAGTTRSNSSPAFAPTAAPATIVPPLSSEQSGAAAAGGANGMPESGPLETRQDITTTNTNNNNENRAALTISAPPPVTPGPNDTTPTTTSTTAHSVDHDNAVDYTTTSPQLPSQPQPLLQPLRRASTTHAAHTNDTSNSGNAGTANGGGGDKDEVEVSSSYTSSTANSPGMDGRPVHSTMVYFKPLSPLTGHNRWVWDCVFSDCCRYLFTASSDNHVRMWNRLLTDRPQSTSFVGHTKPVVAILIYYERRAAPVATET